MFYLFVLAHLVADFALQPLWLVQRKRRWDGLAIHVALVLVCMLLLGALDKTCLALWPAMLAISIVHLCADWWKVNYADRLLRPPLLPFLLDQAIHLATIALVLSLTLPAAQVWSFQGAPLARESLLLAGYVVAALAAPIAVIVWLDPGFAHASQARAARVRALLLGSAVVSMALFATMLALPITLAGIAFVAGRPFSSHPLDRPHGLCTVLAIAAATGAALAALPL